MTTYPDFDSDWRANNSALQACQLTLQSLIRNPNHTSAATITLAFEELKQKQSHCQNLSERINAGYKRAKRERDDLQVQITAAERLKEEKEHAVTKAKEYRAQIKILENKVTALDGTASDSKKEVAKSLKRSIEKVDVKETYQSPLLHPAKRVKGGVGERPSTPSDTPSMSASTPPLPSISPSSTDSARKLATPPLQATPLRKAKPAHFSKAIPLEQDLKFAHTRLARPNRLHNPTKSSSHVTAILQGLAATVKPHEMWTDLSKSEKKMTGFRLLRNDLSPAAVHEEVSLQKSVSAPRAFIDFIAEAQQPHTRPLNAYPLQHHLSAPGSSQITDPAGFLEHTLTKAATAALDHAMKAPQTYHIACNTCNSIPTYSDCDTELRNSSTYTPPTTITEPAYTTSLKPVLTEREIRYAGPAKRTLDQLLFEKFSRPEYTSCLKCSRNNTSNTKRTWLGWAYAPEILSFSLPNKPNKPCRVTLPLEHDFGRYIQASGEKTGYRLVTVVKKLRSGMYAAFVHGEDGKWWRCVDGDVRECRIEEWQGGEGVEVVMYERLE